MRRISCIRTEKTEHKPPPKRRWWQFWRGRKVSASDHLIIEELKESSGHTITRSRRLTNEEWLQLGKATKNFNMGAEAIQESQKES